MEEKNLPMLEIGKRMNDTVQAVIGNEKLLGFEKAYQTAMAIEQLKGFLTPQYMKPIMQLQGNRLGFKTDKDKNGGYSEDIVKNCLIEAVLMGLQPTNNQFNIIAGNTYPTKEGMGYLLANFKGLKYTLTTGLPRINAEKTSCAIQIKIKWTLNGVEDSTEFEQPIKVDAYSTVDAIIGKATRKGRAWLYSKITGTELTDGEVEDATYTVVTSTKSKSPEEKENQRIIDHIEKAESIDDLSMVEAFVNDQITKDLYDKKLAELKQKKKA